MSDKLDIDEIQEAVHKRYAGVAQTAAGQFRYPTGKAGALELGYDLSLVGEVPDEVLVAFCGVGNPFSLGAIEAGDMLLDVGCGAGFDLILASRLVGATGQVCGIDLTPEMVEQARCNLECADVHNGQVCCAGAEAIPYADNTFDVVISNGVLNLSPVKTQSFQEIYRVLKPGGRLQFADIVLQEALPAGVAGSLEAWSGWIGGAIPVRDLVALLEQVGFVQVEYVGATGVTTSDFTVGVLLRAAKSLSVLTR